MSEISLALAPADSSREGFIVLQEPIADEKLADIEVIHIVVDGDASVLTDGAIGIGYVHKAGTIIKALAISREGTATATFEINLGTLAAYPTVAKLSAFAPIAIAAASVGVAVLTTWTVAIPALSIIEAKQKTGSPTACKVADIFLVIQH